MDMTTEKLAELKRVAQNAWPGPWAMNPEPFDNDGTPETVVSAMDGKAAICVTMDWGKNNPLMREANALHIAACDPQTILSLIALAERALNTNPVSLGSLNAERALQPEEGHADVFYAVLNPGGTEGVLFKDIADANFTTTGDCDSWSTPTIGEAFRESYPEEGVLSVRVVVLQSAASQLALPAGPVPLTKDQQEAIEGGIRALRMHSDGFISKMFRKELQGMLDAAAQIDDEFDALRTAAIEACSWLDHANCVNLPRDDDHPDESMRASMNKLRDLAWKTPRRAASPAVAQPVADEREAFEKWFAADTVPGSQGFFSRDQSNPDEYSIFEVQCEWRAWQARAALCQPAEEGGKS